MSKIIYIDRSRIEADWDCPRKRYWNYEHQAPGAEHRGIVRNEDATALIFGSAMHTALSSALMKLLEPHAIAEVLAAQLDKLSYLPEEKFREYKNLGLGLYWGFHYVILPNILAQYDVVAVEGEVEFSISPKIKMMCRPDVVLRRKSDGTYWYPDFKSTAFKNKNWIDSWQYAVQLHSGCAAVEESLGIQVEGAMIIGLYKGYPDKYGKLRSPFTYGYKYKDTTDVWQIEWCRGWELTPVDEYSRGVNGWVSYWAAANPDLIKEQFPMAEEIAFDRDLLENFKKQTAHREHLIAVSAHLIAEGKYAEDELNAFFPQHFKSCRPVIGSACAYIECCNSSSVAADPVGSGLYVVREPHHAQEAMQDEE